MKLSSPQRRILLREADEELRRLERKLAQEPNDQDLHRRYLARQIRIEQLNPDYIISCSLDLESPQNEQCVGVLPKMFQTNPKSVTPFIIQLVKKMPQVQSPYENLYWQESILQSFLEDNPLEIKQILDMLNNLTGSEYNPYGGYLAWNKILDEDDAELIVLYVLGRVIDLSRHLGGQYYDSAYYTLEWIRVLLDSKKYSILDWNEIAYQAWSAFFTDLMPGPDWKYPIYYDMAELGVRAIKQADLRDHYVRQIDRLTETEEIDATSHIGLGLHDLADVFQEDVSPGSINPNLIMWPIRGLLNYQSPAEIRNTIYQILKGKV